MAEFLLIRYLFLLFPVGLYTAVFCRVLAGVCEALCEKLLKIIQFLLVVFTIASLRALAY